MQAPFDMHESGRMPLLFIGHGSPMNAIEDNEFHRQWRTLGRQLPHPKAVLCISAHWETRGVYVSASAAPETIHDFYGFPKALFDVRYPAPGEPRLAGRVAELLTDYGVRPDPERGLDHGAWSVLVAMYPAADVPVVQLSLDTSQPGSFHCNIATGLAPLRDEGVLILASGNIVHNLRSYSYRDAKPLDWAVRFDAEIQRLIVTRELEMLASYEALGPSARLAVPTPEHYLPLLYAVALWENGENLEFFNNTVMSSMSMTSLVIGQSA
jgi:4,5-DOPA dioxygenase extradiol